MFVNQHLLDMKTGDITGDGIIDTVYLYGDLNGPPYIFADNITLIIRDGNTNNLTFITPKNNAGYNARLFLGDFNMNKKSDILLSIDTGGSGGYGIFYIYSFKDSNISEIFNSDTYNTKHMFQVTYEDFYKVRVKSEQLNILFIIDISNKEQNYLDTIYDPNGELKAPTAGEVLALSSLFPIVINQTGNIYDLLGLQRIIGTSNADTLGNIENILTWNGSEFISFHLALSMPGTILTH